MEKVNFHQYNSDYKYVLKFIYTGDFHDNPMNLIKKASVKPMKIFHWLFGFLFVELLSENFH